MSIFVCTFVLGSRLTTLWDSLESSYKKTLTNMCIPCYFFSWASLCHIEHTLMGYGSKNDEVAFALLQACTSIMLHLSLIVLKWDKNENMTVNSWQNKHEQRGSLPMSYCLALLLGAQSTLVKMLNVTLTCVLIKASLFWSSHLPPMIFSRERRHNDDHCISSHLHFH